MRGRQNVIQSIGGKRRTWLPTLTTFIPQTSVTLACSVVDSGNGCCKQTLELSAERLVNLSWLEDPVASIFSLGLMLSANDDDDD